MKKAFKVIALTVAGVCIVTTSVSVEAGGTILPSAGIGTLVDESVSDQNLPGAGITDALNNYYAERPESDAEVIENLVPSVASKYKEIGIAQVEGYVNIRSAADETSEVLGKLYNESAAEVIGEENGWYEITSGTVTGYVKSDYVVTGKAARELAEQVGEKVAVVNTKTLKVRENASTESAVLTLVPEQEELSVVSMEKEWVKVTVDNDVVGFVAAEFVDVSVEFTEAESIEEERARLAAEKAAKEAAEEAARRADEERAAKAAKEAEAARIAAEKAAKEAKAAADKAAAEKAAKEAAAKAEAARIAAEKAAREQEAAKQAEKENNQSNSPSVQAGSSRRQLVAYALQFVGNPYVYGGTSLTKGADCSGFVMAVFRDCGYSIPRDSRSQASSGRAVSLDQIQPGDLIFYAKGGSINHVALYIGNGQVVHASTARTGIKISNYNYRTPVKAVSYMN